MIKRPWPSGLVIAVLATSGSVVALMQTLLVPLLPDLPGLLHVTVDAASWTITATLLTSAVATPSVSKLADMYGKKRMMLISLALMTIGSIFGAVGSGFAELIVARSFQGFAASLIPVAMSIMRDEVPREKLDSALALMSATLGIGAAIGLPVAGVVYGQFGWHAVFWVSAAMGTIMFIATYLIIAESDVRTGGKFDTLGATLMSLMLACLLLGITEGGTWGWHSTATITCFALSFLFLILFVPTELKCKEPLVDLRTTIYGPVAITNIASMVIGFSMYANMLTNTELLQLPKITGYGFGLSVIRAGTALLPAGLTMMLLSPVSAKITKRYGPRITLITGACFLGLGYIFRIYIRGSVFELIIGAIIVSSGTAIAYGAIPSLIMRSVPVSESASANGLNSVIRTIGTSTASAVIAAMLSGMIMSVSGNYFPTNRAFTLIFIIAAGAAFLGGAIAIFLPKKRIG